MRPGEDANWKILEIYQQDGNGIRIGQQVIQLSKLFPSCVESSLSDKWDQKVVITVP